MFLELKFVHIIMDGQEVLFVFSFFFQKSNPILQVVSL